MRTKYPLTRFDKWLFAVIGLGTLIAIGSMSIWLFVSFPLPAVVEGFLESADSSALPQPELQYGRGHTMTTNQGIHSGNGQTIWLVPTIISLVFINILIWTWFIKTRTATRLKLTPEMKSADIGETIIAQPAST